MELLTRDIARTYQNRAKALPYNGMQDIGERRALRIELQERCGVTELEAVNILNGFHIDIYCMKYLIKVREEKKGYRRCQRKSGAGSMSNIRNNRKAADYGKNKEHCNRV